MTTVGFASSMKYGLKLFAYLFLVVLVGGGTGGLGGKLAYSEYQAYTGSGDVNTTQAAAGSILLLLGTVVLVSALIGIAYKLIADSVAAGRRGPATAVAPSQEADADESATGSPEETPSSENGSAATEPDPEPAEPAGEPTAGAAEPAAAGTEPSEQPPTDATSVPSGEPTEPVKPAEGATEGAEATEPDTDTGFQYGRSPGDDDAEGESTAESTRSAEKREPTAEEIAFGSSEPAETDVEEPAPDTGSQGTADKAARNAPSDPLADPTDDE